MVEQGRTDLTPPAHVFLRQQVNGWIRSRITFSFKLLSFFRSTDSYFPSECCCIDCSWFCKKKSFFCIVHFSGRLLDQQYLDDGRWYMSYQIDSWKITKFDTTNISARCLQKSLHPTSSSMLITTMMVRKISSKHGDRYDIPTVLVGIPSRRKCFILRQPL